MADGSDDGGSGSWDVLRINQALTASSSAHLGTWPKNRRRRKMGRRVCGLLYSASACSYFYRMCARCFFGVPPPRSPLQGNNPSPSCQEVHLLIACDEGSLEIHPQPQATVLLKARQLVQSLTDARPRAWLLCLTWDNEKAASAPDLPAESTSPPTTPLHLSSDFLPVYSHSSHSLQVSLESLPPWVYFQGMWVKTV